MSRFPSLDHFPIWGQSNSNKIYSTSSYSAACHCIVAAATTKKYVCSTFWVLFGCIFLKNIILEYEVALILASTSTQPTPPPPPQKKKKQRSDLFPPCPNLAVAWLVFFFPKVAHEMRGQHEYPKFSKLSES